MQRSTKKLSWLSCLSPSKKRFSIANSEVLWKPSRCYETPRTMNSYGELFRSPTKCSLSKMIRFTGRETSVKTCTWYSRDVCRFTPRTVTFSCPMAKETFLVTRTPCLKKWETAKPSPRSTAPCTQSKWNIYKSFSSITRSQNQRWCSKPFRRDRNTRKKYRR